MTDRELLELAAKAAGMKNVKWIGGAGMAEMINPDKQSTTGSKGPIWNPLSDDADALRLAVKLNLSVQRYTYGNCRYAAMRRAIVRSAAEIGKRAST